MTKREWIKVAALGTCGCVLAKLSSCAATEPPPTAPDDDPRADAKDSDVGLCVDDIVTAFRTVDWGRRAQPPSPFALVAASEMLWQLALFDGMDKRLADRIVPPQHILPTNREFLRDEVKNFLQEARDTAKANKQDLATVEKLIDSVRSIRGGLNGPLTFTAELPPGEADTYQIKFKHNEWARIAVRNTGVSPLQLRAVNKEGEPRAEDMVRDPYIAFVPHKKDGSEFTVTVTNLGKEKIVYQLFCN